MYQGVCASVWVSVCVDVAVMWHLVSVYVGVYVCVCICGCMCLYVVLMVMWLSVCLYAWNSVSGVWGREWLCSVSVFLCELWL